MENRSMFVGLDVHKETIDVSIADGERHGEVRHYGVIASDLEPLDMVVRALRAPDRRLRFVYEAGPCGVGIYRHLTGRGEDCVVVSPSMIPKRSGDRVKTDRRDSQMLARLHRAGELRAIYVPDDTAEAMRDLVRAREDAVGVGTHAKYRVKAFLLRQGRRYPGREGWTLPYRRWLTDLSFPSAAQHIALQEYRDAIAETEQRMDRLTEQLRQLAPTWRWAPVVAALQALRGVSFLTAVALVAELGDLTRFRHPRELMAYLGLVPSEHSSGPTVRRGAITKAGHPHVRRLLAEAAWAYQGIPRIGRQHAYRQEALPKVVCDFAWKAQLRLTTRFRRLVARGKAKPKVATAIARELGDCARGLAHGTVSIGAGTGRVRSSIVSAAR
jgi:transposase